MSTPKVPIWSFLAVEPAVKAAVRSSPTAFRGFMSARNSAARATAFWQLFESIEKHAAQRAPYAVLDRHKLAIQSFYALIDLSELRDASDREIQRWLDSILKSADPAYQWSNTAVINAPSGVTVA